MTIKSSNELARPFGNDATHVEISNLKTMSRDMREMALLALVLGLSRAAILLRDVAVANRFGADNVVDAFNTAFLVINWPVQLALSLVGIVFVPVLVRLREARFAAERRRLAQESNLVAVVISLAIAASLFFFADSLIEFFAGDLSRETVALATSFVIVFAPSAGLMLLAGYLGFRLQAMRNRWFTLGESLPALCVMAMLVLPVLPVQTFAGPRTGFGWGLFTGTLLQCLFLVILVRKMGEPLGGLRPGFQSHHWEGIRAGIGAMVIGQVLMAVTTPMDLYFVSRLGDGQMAHFGYASRVITLINTLGSIIIARVLLASFTEQSVRAGRASTGMVLGWASLFLVSGLMVAVSSELVATMGIGALFQRGAFVAADTQAVSRMTIILIFQAPFFLSGLVLVQFFASIGRYDVIASAGVAGLLAKIATMSIGFLVFDTNLVLLSTVVLYFGTSLFLAARYLSGDLTPSAKSAAVGLGETPPTRPAGAAKPLAGVDKPVPASSGLLNELRAIELALVMDGIPTKQEVLDIGAGTGKQAQLLGQRGFRVTALDLSTSNYLKERVWPIIEYDGRNFPFGDGTFDLAFSSNVLEHVFDLPEMHREVLRVLRSGGCCIHVLPTHYWRLWTTLSAFPVALRMIVTARSWPALYRALRRFGYAFLQARHGERGSMLTELYYFRPAWWRRNFRENGFEIICERPVGLFYTGHQVFGAKISFAQRRKLAKLLGSATQVFYLRPVDAGRAVDA